jgi:hypothetical protein
LVPLSIPLVLLGFFWAIGSLDQTPEWGEKTQGVVPEVAVGSPEADGAGTGNGDGIVQGKVEALHK